MKRAREDERKVPDVLLVGTGEYTTGIVEGDNASKSDKQVGVVALCFFEMRRLGKVGNITLCGTRGAKFPVIRKHFEENMAKVYNLDCSFHSVPKDSETDQEAYVGAIEGLREGDIVVVFTPDPLHVPIASVALKQRCHVLVTKPLSQTLQQHLSLVSLAREADVILATEVHKVCSHKQTNTHENCFSISL